MHKLRPLRGCDCLVCICHAYRLLEAAFTSVGTTRGQGIIRVVVATFFWLSFFGRILNEVNILAWSRFKVSIFAWISFGSASQDSPEREKQWNKKVGKILTKKYYGTSHILEFEVLFGPYFNFFLTRNLQFLQTYSRALCQYTLLFCSLFQFPPSGNKTHWATRVKHKQIHVMIQVHA